MSAPASPTIEARLIERPTPLPTGVAAWVKTFRAGWLDVAGVPEDERDEVAAAVERRLAAELQQPDGSWFADYVRLRFIDEKARSELNALSASCPTPTGSEMLRDDRRRVDRRSVRATCPRRRGSTGTIAGPAEPCVASWRSSGS